MAFLRQLQRLLKIVMPGMASKEFLMLVIHSGFLGKTIDMWKFPTTYQTHVPL